VRERSWEGLWVVRMAKKGGKADIGGDTVKKNKEAAMKSGVVKNENEEHFWEIVKKIVERRQNKTNDHRKENKS
jgi:hypothetical protein